MIALDTARSRLIVCALVLVLAGGSPYRGWAEESAALETLPSPPLERLEPAVREALQDALREFESSRRQLSGAVLGTAYGRLGMFFQAHHLQDAAIASYRNARTLAPDNHRWTYYLGYAYQTTGEFAAAQAAYRDALRQRPDDRAALVRLGQVCLEGNQLRQAQRNFEEVLRQDTDNAAALAGLGQIASQSRDYESAITYLTRALAAQPHASQLHYPLAIAYRQTGDVERARAHLEKRGDQAPIVDDPLVDAMQRLTRSAQYHMAVAGAAVREGRYAAAAQAYRAALTANPEDASVHAALGRVLVNLGAADEAMQHYDRALALQGDYAVAHYFKGKLRESLGQDEQALASYKAAVQHDPAYLEARYRLAHVLMRRGEYANAAEQYARIAVAYEHDAELLYRMGVALSAAGRCDEARKPLHAAVSLNPRQGQFLHALARIYAVCGADASELGQALEYAELVYAALPNPEHAVTLAMAYAANGRHDDAVRLQRQVLSSGTESGSRERQAALREDLARYQARQAAVRVWMPGDGNLMPPSLSEATSP